MSDPAFSTQFAYISGVFLWLTSKNLWSFTGNYSHYIQCIINNVLLIKDSKHAGIFLRNLFRSEIFCTKVLFWFYTCINKTHSSLSCHATRFYLHTDAILILSQTIKLWQKSHKSVTAGYNCIAKNRNLVAFFTYMEFSPCRVWPEHCTIPCTIDLYPAQFGPKIPHNFIFCRTISRPTKGGTVLNAIQSCWTYM